MADALGHRHSTHNSTETREKEVEKAHFQQLHIPQDDHIAEPQFPPSTFDRGHSYKSNDHRDETHGRLCLWLFHVPVCGFQRLKFGLLSFPLLITIFNSLSSIFAALGDKTVDIRSPLFYLNNQVLLLSFVEAAISLTAYRISILGQTLLMIP